MGVGGKAPPPPQKNTRTPAGPQGALEKTRPAFPTRDRRLGRRSRKKRGAESTMTKREIRRKKAFREAGKGISICPIESKKNPPQIYQSKRHPDTKTSVEKVLLSKVACGIFSFRLGKFDTRIPLCEHCTNSPRARKQPKPRQRAIPMRL